MDDMTLEQQAGQLLIAGFDGPLISDQARELVKGLNVGGIVLFSSNAENPEQVSVLTRDLQQMARIPLLVAADQEGGIVTRLHTPFTEFPGAMALGAVDDTGLTRRVAAAMGTEMRAVGINWDLAPVADLASYGGGNPAISVRSFGDSPVRTAAHVAAFVQGLTDAGVAACAKHFPGIGDSTTDPHKTMPIVNTRTDLLAKREQIPFKSAIAANVATMMPSHIWYADLDPGRSCPATFSSTIMTSLLRQQLGFDGVGITDDLMMGGITERSTPAEAAVSALAAGCDMVMVCHDLDAQRNTIAAIASAVRAGAIPRTRFEEALFRVTNFKRTTAHDRLSLDTVDWKSHQKLAQKVAFNAATLVHDKSSLLTNELLAHTIVVVYPQKPELTGVEDSEGPGCTLSSELQKLGAHVVCVTYGATPDVQDIQKTMAAISSDSIVFLCTINAHRSPQQRAFVEILENKVPSERLLLVALRDPQDAFLVACGTCAIALYSQLTVSQRAFVQHIASGKPYTGVVPIAMEA